MDSHRSRHHLPTAMLTAFAASFALLVPAAAHAGPRIDRVDPPRAAAGAAVDVIGKGFGSKQTVRIGGRQARVLSVRRAGAKQVLRVVVPSVRAGKRAVSVRRRSRSARRRFVVLPPFSGTIGVTLDHEQAKSADIGPEGGSVAASRRGVRYTLTVPAGALGRSERITVTPISRIKGLPLTGGRPAAVHFAPDGLEFAKAASLAIELPKPASRPLAGFTTSGMGEHFKLKRLEGTRSRVTLPIAHFSTGGAAPVNTADFVLEAQPLLNSVGQGELTEGQVATLVGVYANWTHIFGVEFCDTQPLCDQLWEIAKRNLERLADEYCTAAKAAPDLGGVRNLLRLAGLAQFLALESDEALPCATAVMSTLLDRAVAALQPDPFAETALDEAFNEPVSPSDLDNDGALSNLDWLWRMIPLAGELGIDTSDEQGAAEGVATRTITDGLTLCDTDRTAGRALLVRGRAVATEMGIAIEPWVEALPLCDLTVTVSPSNVTLEVGTFHQFTADTPVEWSATAGTIAANGGYTAPTTQGVYTVRGTSTQRATRFDEATVTVVPPIEVAISPTAASMAQGATKQFTASVSGTDDQRVTWSANGGSISSSGLYTAPTVAGIYTVTVASVANPAKKATAEVTVTSPPNNLGVALHTPFTSNNHVPEGQPGYWWIEITNSLNDNQESDGPAEDVVASLTMTVTYESGGQPRTDANCTPPPTTLAFGDIALGSTATKDFAITCTIAGTSAFDYTVVCVTLEEVTAADGSGGVTRITQCERYRNWPS